MGEVCQKCSGDGCARCDDFGSYTPTALKKWMLMAKPKAQPKEESK